MAKSGHGSMPSGKGVRDFFGEQRAGLLQREDNIKQICIMYNVLI